MNLTWCYTTTQTFIWLPQKQMTKITNKQTDNALLKLIIIERQH